MVSSARFPIAVKVWAGDDPRDFDYVSRSLPSLLGSVLSVQADIVVFNDRSTDVRLGPFLRELQAADRRVRVIEHEFNKGPNLGQADAFEQLADEYSDAEIFVSVDDDAIYHRDWLRRIMQAMDDVRPLESNGVFTSFNTPFRKPHSVVQANGHRYQLKWKQPATNWVIPRDVFEHVGPFRDEGIAFDTVYSHRMRLLGYSVICPRESYVQDIGLSGAYAVDNRLCADRFLGEDNGDSVWKQGVTWLKYHAARVVRQVKSLRHRQPDVLWPVRWGSDWLYEAVGRDGQSIAIWSTDEDVARGWSPSDLAMRSRQMLACQPDGPFALRRLHYSRQGNPTIAEANWKFLPTLREGRELFPERMPSLRQLLTTIAAQLLPLHREGLAHGKVRPENVFLDTETGDVHLAWLGPDVPRVEFDLDDSARCRALFGNAVDRRCRDSVRDLHAAHVMETLAPELTAGTGPSCCADIFAAAATVRSVAGGSDRDWSTSDVLEDCLVTAPEFRVQDAMDLLRRLDGSSAGTQSGHSLCVQS